MPLICCLRFCFDDTHGLDLAEKIRNLLTPISIGLDTYVSSIEENRKKLEVLAKAADMERTKTILAELKTAEVCASLTKNTSNL